MTTNNQPETLHTYNGNNQPMERRIPKIILVVKGDLSPIVLNHIKKNTGLSFEQKHMLGYEVQPETSNQIVRLLLTYDLKTYYHDNLNYENTMFVTFHDIMNQLVWDMMDKS